MEESSNHPIRQELLTIKKTFYHNWIPTKMEEESGTFRPTKTLIEIRDLYPAPSPQEPWPILKTMSFIEIKHGVVCLSHHEAFEHVFRYWDMEKTREIVEKNGSVSAESIWDLTAGNSYAVRYGDETTLFRKHSDDCYLLGIGKLIESRRIGSLDKIGLKWSAYHSCFHFAVLGW